MIPTKDEVDQTNPEGWESLDGCKVVVSVGIRKDVAVIYVSSAVQLQEDVPIEDFLPAWIDRPAGLYEWELSVESCDEDAKIVSEEVLWQ